MLPVSNKIERVLVLPADPKTVWEKSFGTPEALMSWFPDKIEGEFKVGEKFFLIFVDGENEHRCQCVMTEFTAMKSFEFQWHPGVSDLLDAYPDSELTTVRFTFEPGETKGGNPGTTVTMIETGFAKIAKKRRQFAFEANNGGWTIEIAKLPKGY